MKQMKVFVGLTLVHMLKMRECSVFPMCVGVLVYN